MNELRFDTKLVLRKAFSPEGCCPCIRHASLLRLRMPPLNAIGAHASAETGRRNNGQKKIIQTDITESMAARTICWVKSNR